MNHEEDCTMTVLLSYKVPFQGHSVFQNFHYKSSYTSCYSFFLGSSYLHFQIPHKLWNTFQILSNNFQPTSKSSYTYFVFWRWWWDGINVYHTSKFFIKPYKCWSFSFMVERMSSFLLLLYLYKNVYEFTLIDSF